MIRFPPMQLASTLAAFRLRQFASLTKPRVVSLIVFGAARYIPITAQNTISDTTRGLVRLRNWRRRKPATVEASCMGRNFITLLSPP